MAPNEPEALVDASLQVQPMAGQAGADQGPGVGRVSLDLIDCL